MSGREDTGRTIRLRDGAEVEVRPLSAREIAGLARFNAALSASSRALFLPHAYDETTLTRQVARHTRGEDLSLVVAEDERIVAYAFLWEYDRPFPLLGLGVADAWQGRGLGGALLDRLVAAAVVAARDGIELTTVPHNTRARSLYESRGFRVAGEGDNIAGDGRVVRELRMCLALRAGRRSPERRFAPPG
jgi:ribosomal protein S18 acetylase RimI-like enzyme